MHSLLAQFHFDSDKSMAIAATAVAVTASVDMERITETNLSPTSNCVSHAEPLALFSISLLLHKKAGLAMRIIVVIIIY